MKNRKLQVFVSSTYEDLKDYREAAVKAILEAKHIPAGMELFAAGDAGQWEVITNWIRDSDALIVIAGGRYGSLHPDTGKSYTESEFEYAGKRRIPRIALIASEGLMKREMKGKPTSAIADFADALKFHGRLKGSGRIVKFFSDKQELKLQIVQALTELGSTPSLKGWVRDGTSACGAEVLFPRTWPTGVGKVQDIEATHNYATIGSLIHDTANTKLLIGSPYLRYWVEGDRRLQTLLDTTKFATIEVVLYRLPNTDVDPTYESSRQRTSEICRDLCTRNPGRLRFTESEWKTDLSYITYPTRPNKGQCCRAVVGFQAHGYAHRPFLEFNYDSKGPAPAFVEAILTMHAREAK